MIRLQVTGADAASRQLLAAADIDEQAVAQAVAEVVAGRARVVVPKRTGRLMRSIDLQRVGDTITVAASAPYAAQVSYGGRHNPRPVPFMDIAVADSGARMGAAADAQVTLQLERAGVL